MERSALKEKVRRFWDQSPCGVKEVSGFTEGSKEFFESLEKRRYRLNEFVPGLVQFERWRGKKVLEMGCGAGVDLVQFVRAEVETYGIDLSFRSIALAKRWLDLEGLRGFLCQTDAEDLPFQDNAFDLVYAWGVLHHTPDTLRAVREMIRVCKKGGEIFAMLYHRHSLVALQVWLRYGLLRGRPLASLRRLIAEHMESCGTRAFTRKEAVQLFSGLEEMRLRTIVTRYDLRIGRRRFLPRFFSRWIPSSWGWFLVVRAKKPQMEG